MNLFNQFPSHARLLNRTLSWLWVKRKPYCPLLRSMIVWMSYSQFSIIAFFEKCFIPSRKWAFRGARKQTRESVGSEFVLIISGSPNFISTDRTRCFGGWKRFGVHLLKVWVGHLLQSWVKFTTSETRLRHSSSLRTWKAVTWFNSGRVTILFRKKIERWIWIYRYFCSILVGKGRYFGSKIGENLPVRVVNND